MTITPRALALLALAAAPAAAQLPSPNPIPRTAPRAAWSLVSGVVNPTQRRENPGAASNTHLYVFGGRNGNANTTVHNALYEYNGTSWTLRNGDTAATTVPTARGGACVAWNFSTNKLMVFGGDTGTGLVGGPAVPTTLLGDTWEWDPQTNAWTDLTPSLAVSPSPRRFSAMSWDASTGGMILFGGDVAIPAALANDTWLFSNGSWTQLNPATAPSARRQHSLVSRPEMGDVLLCAGVTNPAVPTGTNALDVWALQAGNWVQLNDGSQTFPHGCVGNQAVYDQIRRRVVLQGGNGLRVIDNTLPSAWDGSPSTWCSEFDSRTNQWVLYGAATFNVADPVIGRASRYFAAYVPALGKVYKLSGQNPSGTGTTTGLCAYQATPVASAVAYGNGCSGSAGPVALASVFPNDRPWIGANFDFAASGIAPGGFALGVVGFSQIQIPLSVIGPAGLPGCDFLCALDLSFTMPVNAGIASASFPIPNGSFLAGGFVHQQVLQIELAPTLALSSSNGMTSTIGFP
ncbi:MAG: hypothetical protein IPN34_11735 [Planctomycetes bacterium]|nr:hypothetical protein [Planctomycetota bacterium]